MWSPDPPRVLVIDDDARVEDGDTNLWREQFCRTHDVREVQIDDEHLHEKEAGRSVADAVFCSGQTVNSRDKITNDLSGTIDLIRKGWSQQRGWTLLLLDLRFVTEKRTTEEANGLIGEKNPEDYFGLKILRAMDKDKELSRIPVVILSAMEPEPVRDIAARNRAWEFVPKDNLREGNPSLDELIQRYGLVRDNRIVGTSVELLECLRDARNRAQRSPDENILAMGETGTGKELLAEYVHRKSINDGDCVTVFTQGVAENLIEDELFGHVKGAFSGADQSRPGKAEMADGGVLHIDEFGEIPERIQSKLLRLLDTEQRETQRLGSNERKKLTLQVVLATNRLKLLESSDFRSDLLHRVNITNAITLPPLRERKEDIPLLAEDTVRSCEERFGLPERDIPGDTIQKLMQYNWPGNIRQLKNVVEQAVLDRPRLQTLSPNLIEFDTVEDRKVQPPEAGDEMGGVKQTETNDRVQAEGSGDEKDKELDLEHVVNSIDKFETNTLETSELVGSLEQLRASYQTAILKLFRDALDETKDPLSEGEDSYNITKSVKLLTGQNDLSTAEAYSEIIKMCEICEERAESFMEDHPAVRSVYDKAVEMRR